MHRHRFRVFPFRLSLITSVFLRICSRSLRDQHAPLDESLAALGNFPQIGTHIWHMIKCRHGRLYLCVYIHYSSTLSAAALWLPWPTMSLLLPMFMNLSTRWSAQLSSWTGNHYTTSKKKLKNKKKTVVFFLQGVFPLSLRHGGFVKDGVSMEMEVVHYRCLHVPYLP